jgi:hypothetical protein
LEPEFEMAIRVASIVEAFWEGKPPTVKADHEDHIEFSDLLPEIFKIALKASTLKGEIAKFLGETQYGRQRLRRAAKAAGLWMRERKRDVIDTDFPERYVPVRTADDLYLSPSREFKPSKIREEASTLKELVSKCSDLLAGDLTSASKLLDRYAICTMFEAQSYNVCLSFVRHKLTAHFYGNPECLAESAKVLDYLPSFAAVTAQAVLEYSGVKATILDGAKPGTPSRLRVWRNKLASRRLGINPALVKSFSKGSDPDCDELAQKLIEHVPENIKKGSHVRSSLSFPPEQVHNLQFAVGTKVLASGQCCNLASRLELSVPFVIAFRAELEEIDKRRKAERVR